MNSTSATSKRLGPEHVSSSAPIFGQRLTFQTFSGGVHLHQYELVPGGWSHEALDSWRIAFQQTGSPRVIRKVGNQRERQLRPAGTISINPPSPQSWTWDCKMRVALLFISQDVISEVLSEAGMDRQYGELVTPLVIDDPLIKQTIVEMLSEAR